MKICPQCNIEYQDNMKFCPECGSKLEYKPNVCPNCGTKYKGYQKFCVECGTKLEMTSEGNLYQKQFSSEIEELCKKGVDYCDKAQNGNDYKKALVYLNKAAEAGHPKAMYYLGLCYEEGSGVEVDFEKSFNWYSKAAKENYIDAQLSLGYCYYLGDGVEVDYEEAIVWFSKAAEAGKTEALEWLGRCSLELDEIDKAIEWYTQSVEVGSVDGMVSLGDIYSDNNEYNKAIEWYYKAAEAGSTDALGRLKDLSDEGLFDNNIIMELVAKMSESCDVEKLVKIGDINYQEGNIEKAIDLYNQAANFGSGYAQCRLGDIYYVIGDFKKAINCYDLASNWYDSNHSNDYILGECYRKKGDCLFELRNYPQAINCYQEATKHHGSISFLRLGDLYLLGIGVERKYDEAYGFYKKCIEKDKYNFEAQDHLKRIYDQNGNVNQDVFEGFEIQFIYNNIFNNHYSISVEKYEKAAEKGDPKAQYELAKLYFHGKGIHWDINQASELFRKAAKQYWKLAEDGDRNAQLIVGDCICYGETSEDLRAKSHHWYKLAAEAGLPEAQFALGNAYKNGIGSKIHITKAVQWYEKASQAGNIESKFALGKMYSDYLTCKQLGIKEDYRKSFPLFKSAAESGHSKAQYELARHYEKGYGVTKNVVLAYNWYKQSYENGEFDSYKQMERLRKDHPNISMESQRSLDHTLDQSGNILKVKTENTAIDRCIPNVFFIKAVNFDITYPDGNRQQTACGEGGMPSWTGTGFLLSDGRFVTARHVVEAWAFPSGSGQVDEAMVALNLVANNGGKVVAKFEALSSNGTKIQFSSDQCVINHRNDRVQLTEKGAKMVVARMSYDDTDYAYFHSGHTSGLGFNVSASTTLAMRTELVVLGFPLGIGANSATDISPIYGSGIVAKTGLQNGVILTTDTNYEQGNSGGPVFITNSNGDLEVIGLVSAGAGRTMGFIVPIAAVK